MEELRTRTKLEFDLLGCPKVLIELGPQNWKVKMVARTKATKKKDTKQKQEGEAGT